ncbi:MAG: glycosyltransferase family protein, partial [Vulcanimicrobiaceae bacterium]
GHPLSGSYELRAERPAPPLNGGTVAILPGSRRAEIVAHFSRLLGAVRCLRERRPDLRAIVGAANEQARSMIEAAIARSGLRDIEVVDSGRAALERADAAWVASGTAVLEASLMGVPTVSLYVLSRLLVRHARRVYSGRFITLANLILEREVVKELLQDEATPQALAAEMDAVLRHPAKSRQDMRELHDKLGHKNSALDIATEAFRLAKSA